jgi:hypothetical protein
MHFPTINPGKPPHFDGTRYTDWAYKMKMHLIDARIWEIVDVGVFIPTDEEREMTLEPKCSSDILDSLMFKSR